MQTEMKLFETFWMAQELAKVALEGFEDWLFL